MASLRGPVSGSSTYSFHPHASTSALMPRELTQNKPATADLSVLAKARDILHGWMEKDAQMVPDLKDTLTGTSSASYTIPPHRSWTPFFRPDGVEGFVSMPAGVFDEYDEVQPYCCMGIFPEIQRAWITLNNRLLLWNYNEGPDLRTFEEHTDIILHVGLVKAKPSVFIDDIQYLLVLSTAKQITLIGVGKVPAVGNGPSSFDVKLFDTGFSLPAKEMQSIVGTKDGRIFMCGTEDGYLYELEYRSSEKWFTNKLNLVCHSTAGGITSLLPAAFASWGMGQSTDDRIVSLTVDNARQYLYALTARPQISLFYLGPQGNTLTPKGTVRNIVADTNRIVPMEPFSIVDLHVIPRGSRVSDDQPQLMAITTNGTRLYFSKQRYIVGMEPDSLQLTHVRPPPQNLRQPAPGPIATSRGGYFHPAAQPNTATFIIRNVDGSTYSAGVTLARQSPGDDPQRSDDIICMAPDVAALSSLSPHPAPAYNSYSSYSNLAAGPRVVLTEYASVLQISGNAWAMCEVPMPPTSKRPPETPVSNLSNELATQFSQHRRSFLVVTNTGINVIVKRRAVDLLSASLVEEDMGNQAPVQDFFANFGRDQTCAMLFALAAGNTFLGSDLGPSHASSIVSNTAKALLFSQSGKPQFREVGLSGAINSGDGNIVFSGRHAGFALYLMRILRPIWLCHVTAGDTPMTLTSNVSESTLIAVQKNLESLRHFLATNPHLFDSTQSDITGNRATAEQEALKAENASASVLKTAISPIIEAISFVLLLQDYGLPQIATACGEPVYGQLMSLRYREFITTKEGRDVSKALVTALINQQIAQQISVDTISEVLQSRCGSFCSLEDVKYFKAQESLRKATESTNPDEKARSLHDSLKLFVDGARIMDLQSLSEIVEDYRQCSYATGAIFLPLRCAQEFDPTNEGRDYWLVGCPGDTDPRKQLFEKRRACYQICFDSLEFFDERHNAASKISPAAEQDASSVQTRAYQLAFESQDQIFHSFFYDWLIGHGRTEELVEYRPPFLEEHLSREPRSLDKLNFLWQYYVKTDQALHAAKVLADIAQSKEFDLTIDRRIEYLTLAVNNAKSHSSSEMGRLEPAVEFLTDLEERLEVAQVQREVLHALYGKLGNPQGEDMVRVGRLETELLNITQLYSEYAEPYNLYVMKLLVFKVSDYRDSRLTQSTWDAVIGEARQGVPPEQQMANVSAVVSGLASRFFPSEAAFPLDNIALMLEKLALENRHVVAQGWAPRTLASGGVPYGSIFDAFHNMYESQIPPFNVQDAVQFLSGDIAILVSDWLDEAVRPQSRIARSEFPANLLDEAVNQYLRELDPARTETRQLYENLRVRIRRYF